MWSLHLAILFLLVPTYILNIQEASGCNRRVLVQDSIIIAASNNTIVIKEDVPTASIALKASKQQPFNKSKKYSILLNGIQMKQSPEGVYELYIIQPNTNPAKLVDDSPYFVDVLDTYTIANSKGPQRISLDVTNHLLDQNKNSSYLLNYTITVLFRGNVKPDNTSARNAGLLIIDTIQLLQTNKT